MARILMRAPHSPLSSVSPEQAILHDRISTNAGNLLFPYSISRALMTPSTRIDYVQNRPRAWRLPAVSRYVNDHYDCFVIPLANAFRSTFAPDLDMFSEFIETLDIPCIVIGVGLQAGVKANGRKSYPFDDSVRRFMRAVLEKSDCVGVRGATTGAYLERLGFSPERDFTVIGCPSLYLYGPYLPKPRETVLSPSSSISINCKVSLKRKIHDYMSHTARLIPDFHYVVQNRYELASLYYGLDLRETHPKGAALAVPEGYPTGAGNPTVVSGRVVGFVDVPSWLAFLEGKDLSFGTRIHGNIAGILAGAPTFVVAPDSRVLELARYHSIPHTRLKDLDGSKDIFHLLDGVDFDQVLEGHGARFSHYLDFLHRNGLETVYDGGTDGLAGELPFDKAAARVAPNGPVKAKRRVSSVDKARWRLAYARAAKSPRVR